jgi:hypothetical protein
MPVRIDLQVLPVHGNLQVDSPVGQHRIQKSRDPLEELAYEDSLGPWKWKIRERAVALYEVDESAAASFDRLERSCHIPTQRRPSPQVANLLACEQRLETLGQGGDGREGVHHFMSQHMSHVLPRLQLDGVQLSRDGLQRDQSLRLVSYRAESGDGSEHLPAVGAGDHVARACLQQEQVPRGRGTQSGNLLQMTDGAPGQIARRSVCQGDMAVGRRNDECGTRRVEQRLKVVQPLFSLRPRCAQRRLLAVPGGKSDHFADHPRYSNREKNSGAGGKQRRRIIVSRRDEPGCHEGERAYGQRPQSDLERKSARFERLRVHAWPCADTAPRGSIPRRRRRMRCFPELFAALARSRLSPGHRVASTRRRDGSG